MSPHPGTAAPTAEPAGSPRPRSSWQAANRRHLAASVARIRLLVRRRVLWLRRCWAHDPLAAHRGAVVSDERADRLMAGPDLEAERAFHRSDPAAREVADDLRRVGERLEAARREAEAAGRPPRADEIGRRFGLSPFETDVLLLAFAPEMEPDLGELYAYAQDDATRSWATPALALEVLVPDRADRDGARRTLGPGGPLRRHGLLELETGSPTAVRRPLRVPERVQAFLRDEEPPGLPAWLTPIPPAPLTPALEELARATASSPDLGLSLVGPRGSGRRALARALGASRGLEVRALDVAAAGGNVEALERERRDLEREARLAGIALYVELETLEAVEPPALRSRLLGLLDRLDVPFVAGGARRWPGDRPLAALHVPELGPTERRKLWRTALEAEGLEPGPDDVGRLAHPFPLGPTDIAEVARSARRMADFREPGAPTDPVALAWRACRDRNGPSLDALARRIEASRSWDDLVLPDDAMAPLRELTAQLRHRDTVYETWGFGAALGRRRGIGALFAGPSGTGKTLAAEVLADELDLPLYRIDLSGVVSKYIGETEKNLGRVFDAAEETGAVLFFDEADALFGKRSEVKDARDRYANMEVSYLLQRMEDYGGLVVLATNLKSHVDPAFLRRLRFVIDFPFPGPGERARIWATAFPDEADLGPLDMDALARLEVAGGNIRNIAVNGAFLAAAEGGRVEMRHLWAAARREYAKIEKLVDASQFGGGGRAGAGPSRSRGPR